MTFRLLTAIGLAASLFLSPHARAGQAPFSFSGTTTSGSGTLTYGTDSVANDPTGAYAITGITGTFSDANLGLVDVQITGLVPIDPGPWKGAPFPASLSTDAATNPFTSESISYDNLYYPGGSPITCPGYPLFGGYLDIFGVFFTLSNGDAVDFWSNGGIPGVVSVSYGIAVVDLATNTVVDYQSAVPEPGSVGLLATGLIGVLVWRRRKCRPGDV